MDFDAACELFDRSVAEALIDRLADIRAAESLLEVLDVEAKLHQGQVLATLDLASRGLLIIKSNDPSMTWDPEQVVDLGTIWRVKVIDIEVPE